MNLELASVYLRDLMNEIYKKLVETGIKYIIINGYTKIGYSIRFSTNKIDLFKRNISHEIVIGISDGKGIYLSRLKSLDVDIENYVKNLLSSFKRWRTDLIYSPPEVCEELYEIIVGAYDDKILDIEFSTKLIDSLLNDVGNKMRVSGTLHLNALKHILKTSYNCEGEYKLTNYLLNIRGFKNRDISYTVNRTGSSIRQLDYSKLVNEITSSVSSLDFFDRVEEGVYTVVFSPLAFANIINYIGNMFSGAEIYSNISPFSQELGKRISNKEVNIYDDPREAGSPNASTFDEEGVLRRRIYFLKEGIVNSYALNSLYAGLLGMESTGHAGILYPYPKSIVFSEKEPVKDETDLYSEIKDGILINNLWYTRFSNYKEGVFSTLQRDIGIYIKNGELRGAFKGARINLSVEKLFKDLLLSTKNRLWVRPWDVTIPVKTGYIAIKDVKVTTGI